MSQSPHKAGFVSIIGKPNVGKSTLMNALVGERLSIITSKAQTTRHRIMGIVSGDDFQLVYSDTPGVLKPEYKLHSAMMSFVRTSLEDADVLLLVADLYEKMDDYLQELIKQVECPVLFVLNKIDLGKGSQVEDKMTYWKEHIKADAYFLVSAMEGTGVDEVFNAILEHLPEHPAFFPKDELTDKPERFFVNEIIREKIFQNYKKEVPYSTEVVTTEFQEDEKLLRIRAEIYVERDSQKGILIGKGGIALKKVGIAAREDLEKFFGKQVFLETFVKVAKDWRRDGNLLKQFNYKN